MKEHLSIEYRHWHIALLIVAAIGGCGILGNGEVPSAPENAIAESGSGEVVLHWTSSEGADTYNIYRSKSNIQSLSMEPLSEGIRDTSFTDTSVENGSTYHYRVTGVNETGEGEPSEEVISTPFAKPPGRPE